MNYQEYFTIFINFIFNDEKIFLCARAFSGRFRNIVNNIMKRRINWKKKIVVFTKCYRRYRFDKAVGEIHIYLSSLIDISIIYRNWTRRKINELFTLKTR